MAAGHRIWLEEQERRFDAMLLNQFDAIEGGAATRYSVTGYVSLRGVYRALQPLLRGFVRRRVRRQITEYVLE